MTKIDIVRSWIRWVLWWMCHVQICRIVYNDWHMRYTSWLTKAWEECNMIYYASDCVFSWYVDMHLIVLWSFPSIIEKLSWALNWFIENMGCLSMLNGRVGQQNTGNQHQQRRTRDTNTNLEPKWSNLFFEGHRSSTANYFIFLKVNGVLLQMKALPSGKIT